ncbi:MAG: hypothetical protein WA485_02510 [Candidatus Sulfotelmatobacter sp.]
MNMKVLFVVASICVLLQISPRIRAEEDDSLLELTQVDLFSVSKWESKPIAIKGFTLGMTRAEAFTLAKTLSLRLVTETPRTVGETNGACRSDEISCSVYRVNGPWIGMNLWFNAVDRVGKITVSMPADAVPEVKAASVAHEFKGLTYELFNNYSEALRQRVLGFIEAKERQRTNIPGDTEVVLDYTYPRLGMVVHLTIDKRDHPPKPFDLQVDFVAPR